MKEVGLMSKGRHHFLLLCKLAHEKMAGVCSGGVGIEPLQGKKVFFEEPFKFVTQVGEIFRKPYYT